VATGQLDPYTIGAHYLAVADDAAIDGMNAMSYRSATSRQCAVWRQVDGSPGTVAALLHSENESPCTVAAYCV
jgi:hypothetical protein